jgi:Protein kinase domain.
MEKSEIKFLKEKAYKYIRPIGRGGYGETILIEDQTIDQIFVCKKYSPILEKDQYNYFTNFKREIKLLHLINFRNIVRVFNYYLYPEKQTGYILMEYIEGNNIQEYLQLYPEKINDIFVQVLEGFEHLESFQILHRDIRPQNILISKDHIVKIIDFGFGKKIEFGDNNFDKSISLNWRYSIPSEFVNKLYDYKSELYFVGKLFEEIIAENKIQSFAYGTTLEKMITVKYEARINSFFELKREIYKTESSSIDFNNNDKLIYRDFAKSLEHIYTRISKDSEYISDVDKIIQNLEKVHSYSVLEEFIQNVSVIGTCFLRGSFRYNKKSDFHISTLKNFIVFLKLLPREKQNIVLNNMWQRLDTIPRYNLQVDDLPF